MIDLATNRRLTKSFIEALPVELVLTPRARTRTSTGGYTWTELEPRDPQTFTLIEPGSDSNPYPTVTTDGVERVIVFELLGEWDAQLARFDTFTHQGKDFEVVEMFYDNGWERRALVAGRG